MFRVYVAGPLTRCGQDIACYDRIHLNVNIALAAGADLIAKGYNPYVPHYNQYMQDLMNVDGPDHDGWLAMDFEWLEHCHAVLRLPGKSPGADRETMHAEKLNIPVAHSLKELDAIHDIWLHMPERLNDLNFLAAWSERKPGVTDVIAGGTPRASQEGLNRLRADIQRQREENLQSLNEAAKREIDANNAREKLLSELRKAHPDCTVEVQDGGMLLVSLAKK